MKNIEFKLIAPKNIYIIIPFLALLNTTISKEVLTTVI